MGIISWIILGLIAGYIGSKIVDKQGQGFWLNTALGLICALVGSKPDIQLVLVGVASHSGFLSGCSSVRMPERGCFHTMILARRRLP